MRWIKAIAKELFGLFVDDEAFATAIIVWIGVIWFLSLHVITGLVWNGPALFAGLAVILVHSAVRRSRK